MNTQTNVAPRKTRLNPKTGIEMENVLIGSLWVKSYKDKDGQEVEYYNGKINEALKAGTSITLFCNTNPKVENSPDFFIFTSVPVTK